MTRVLDAPAGSATAPPGLAALRIRYQRALAVVTVVLFFTNVLVWQSEQGYSAIPPAAVLVGLAALSLPLLLSSEVSATVLRNPLVLWTGGYLALTAAGFFYSTQRAATLEALAKPFAAAIALAVFLVVAAEPGATLLMRRVMIWLVLFGVAANLLEVWHPAPTHPGRSAGLYQNPNISGAALSVGLILTLDLVPPRLRQAYAAIVVLGVVPTFSRGAIFTLGVTGLLLLSLRAIRISRGFLVGLVLAGCLIVAVVPVSTWRATYQALRLLTNSRIDRLAPGPTGAGDVSGSIRVAVAREAWGLFIASPLVGAGLGATQDWDFTQSTHNMYLRFLGEFGFLGLAVYLAGLASVLWRFPRTMRTLSWSFAAWWLLWGAFSHNLLEERHSLLAMALVATMTTAARLGDGRYQG